MAPPVAAGAASAPWWGPAAIGAAGSVLGGLVGSGGSGYNQHKDKERKLLKANIKTATLGHTPIQWVVNDAKKAGIHPLYALGQGGHSGAMAPYPSGGGKTSGSALGRGISEASSRLAGGLERAQIRALEASASKDYAEGQKALSEAKRAEAAVNHSQDGRLMSDPVTTIGGGVLEPGMSSPAEAFETRYGEVGDWFGMMNVAADYQRMQRKAARKSERISRIKGEPVKKDSYYRGKLPLKKAATWNIHTFRKLGRWLRDIPKRERENFLRELRRR